MSWQLHILLIIVTVALFIILIKNVKKGKLRSDYASGWVLCSLILVLIAIFPQIIYFISRQIKVMSPANLIFAIIILLLIILVYILLSKVSSLEEKQKNIIQEIAILKEKNNLK